MFPSHIIDLAEKLQKICIEKKLKITVAESCTGGLIGGLITSIAGSSEIFERGFITYTNQAKGEILGVPAHIFMAQGAVSDECATAMAEGALTKADADLSVSVTGIAGPSGATATKPVGLVHLAVARKGLNTYNECHEFKGDRTDVREQAVESAMKLLNKAAEF